MLFAVRQLKSLGFIGLIATFLTACPDDGGAGGTGNTLGPTSGASDTEGTTDGASESESDSIDPDGTDGMSDVCLLQNCESNDECGGCSEGRNTCYLPDKRCVACDPDSGQGCPDGLRCTEFGSCVDPGLECPTDEDGVPTFECNDDPECGACDPDHQVCAAGQCVQCRGDALDACQSTEACIGNVCVSKCPESCTTNDECAGCGTELAPATACHNHACAECSNSSSTPVPCPSGEYCTDAGSCAAICGIPGQSAGACDSDDDCEGCEGDNTNCVIPINSDRGICGPFASGCSDLGEGVVVLPEPFSQVTNACSNDTDCEGIGVQYNVGQLLRELSGFDNIDDANIFYPMAACAELTVGTGGGSISCGICVPCEEDDDCLDLDIDQVAGDAFGPLGPIVTALLLDSLFGPNDHLIYMQCQEVVAGYGFCKPCSNLLNDCTGGGGGGETGTCDHSTSEAGGPLNSTCGPCAAAVCENDGYCCSEAWDEQCVEETDIYCGSGECHDQCVEGPALDPSCNDCVSDICDQDAWCCENEWDEYCTGYVDDICGGECVGDGCSHSECNAGGALPAACSTCASDVCDVDAFCCTDEWDLRCTAEAETICSTCNDSCAHDPCTTGGALNANCGACAELICGLTPTCCSGSWNAACVADAAEYCAC